MKKSALIGILTLYYAVTLCAQEVPVPRFSKYQIGNTGRFAYLPADPGDFEVAESEDGSNVYWGEAVFGEYFFAVIMVEFADVFQENPDPEEMEILLTVYMDYLQEQFEITSATGYGKGHTMESNPDALGIIDFWEDANETQYAVKGWIDKEVLAVLLLYGPDEFPHFNARQLFLNGFRFN